VKWSKGRLVAAIGMFSGWRRNSRSARDAGMRRMHMTLIDDCERLAAARRRLASNDNRARYGSSRDRHAATAPRDISPQLTE
jgi:hypothetical protein